VLAKVVVSDGDSERCALGGKRNTLRRAPDKGRALAKPRALTQGSNSEDTFAGIVKMESKPLRAMAS